MRCDKALSSVCSTLFTTLPIKSHLPVFHCAKASVLFVTTRVAHVKTIKKKTAKTSDPKRGRNHSHDIPNYCHVVVSMRLKDIQCMITCIVLRNFDASRQIGYCVSISRWQPNKCSRIYRRGSSSSTSSGNEAILPKQKITSQAGESLHQIVL